MSKLKTVPSNAVLVHFNNELWTDGQKYYRHVETEIFRTGADAPEEYFSSGTLLEPEELPSLETAAQHGIYTSQEGKRIVIWRYYVLTDGEWVVWE